MFNKKIALLILTVVVLLGGFLFVREVRADVKAQKTLADDIQKQNEVFASNKGANFGVPEDPRTIIARIIKIALSFIGTIFFIYMVYGGAIWLLSAGEEDKIEKAQSIIKTSVIGVILILMSYSIVWMTYSVIYWGQQDPFDSTDFTGIRSNTRGFYQNDPLEQDTGPDILFQ